ncbi:MAG: aconitase X swivel domain-containing protein [Candidatus Bathyarchaeota archaeon]
MRIIRAKGRSLVKGESEGLALVTRQPISFFGGVNPEKGLIVEKGHELENVKITDRILVFPYGKGSSVGAYIIYSMAKLGTAPKAIINRETEVIIASGCALANIPLVDRLEKDPVKIIKTGDYVKILKNGFVEIRKGRLHR